MMGFAGDGLRSDGVDDLPPSKSGCSILPIVRYCGEEKRSALDGDRRADAACWRGDYVRPHRAAFFLTPNSRGVSMHLTP